MSRLAVICAPDKSALTEMKEKITAGALSCDLWDSVAMKALDDVAEVLCEIPDENEPRVFRMFANASKPEANTSSTLVGGMVKAMKATSIVDE